MADETDRIERSIEIEADVGHVWTLVSEPGWWVNDGRIVEHKIQTDGDRSTVTDPMHGDFVIRTVRLEPPHYAAFRWLSGKGGTREPEEQSTLVEFWIQERPTGGVSLRVVESGLDALDLSEQQRRTMLVDNTEGWEQELAAARTLLQ